MQNMILGGLGLDTVSHIGGESIRNKYLADSAKISAAAGWVITDPAIAAATYEATQAEHARIVAALEKIKPTDQPYSRKSWNDELIGERRMFDRMMKAITAPAKAKLTESGN